MGTKSVILFLVEGASDEAAFGTIFEKIFDKNSVKMAITRGDITTRNDVEKSNVLNKLEDFIDDYLGKYGFEWEDLVKIFHITDMDGCAISDEFVKQCDDRGVFYYADHIETDNVWSGIVECNNKKADMLIKLSRENYVHKVPYGIYFNSCNLEHVLFDRLENISADEKMDLADEFVEKYENDIDAFISFINDESLAVKGSYADGWKYILKRNQESLHRHSNMHQIIKEHIGCDHVSEDENGK